MDKDFRLQIEYLPIEALKPYKRNTRKHEERDILAITESIKQFGFNDPIGLWHDTIVEGHGRLLAAKELGMTEIPVIRLEHLTDEQRKAYAIAHNKTAENSDWDRVLLGDELRELEGAFDMTDFGFGDFELTMLAHSEDITPDDYEDADGIADYDEVEVAHLAKKRVIITYTEGAEALVAEILGVQKLDKVVYDIKELRDASDC